MQLLNKLGRLYLYSNLDSCYYFASLSLDLAQKLRDQRGQSIDLHLLGNMMEYSGNYPEALRLNLESLQLAEQVKDEESVADALNSLGALYYFEKDYRQALDYFFKALRKCDDNHNRQKEREMLNIGDTYLSLHRLDSARHFTELAYQMSVARGDLISMSDELANLGEIYAALNQNELAHRYYRLGMATATRASAFDNFCVASLGSAKLFAKENRKDSALSFARLSLTTARSSKLMGRQLDASNFIESVFETDKQADSSLFYLKLTIALQDSLYSKEKLMEVQTMTLEENMRQRDLAMQKKRAEENAANNIQLIAIALFIPVFFLIVVFLARIKVKARVIEFLAVVNLLLLFEFITDVAFPYISDWTHDSPAWEMLILVLIAALLEPLNYRIEHWVKVKLLPKPPPPPDPFLDKPS
jgi:tetratricopeptide (TPR) repeat protein